MSAVPSTMLALGTKAPDFRLPSTAGGTVSLDDYSDGQGLLVMFISNHCPFVKHVRSELSTLTKEYESRGIAVVAINANDWEAYPDDCPAMMAKEIEDQGYTFPYLFDETQETAKAYHAACTPDFFLFDAERKLVYRGQMDGSRPGNDIPVTGSDLRTAMDALLAGDPVGSDQKPSIGCNIKWRPGKAPDYFSA